MQIENYSLNTDKYILVYQKWANMNTNKIILTDTRKYKYKYEYKIAFNINPMSPSVTNLK